MATCKCDHRHILRDRQPSTAACPAFWAMGCTTSPTNQPREDPFHLYSLSPHSPQFQHKGPALSSLSECEISELKRVHTQVWIVHRCVSLKKIGYRQDVLWKGPRQHKFLMWNGPREQFSWSVGRQIAGIILLE